MGSVHTSSKEYFSSMAEGKSGVFILEELPEELFVHVLSFLPPKDLLSYKRVCKHWRALIDGASLWKLKCDRDLGIVVPYLSKAYHWDYQRLYIKNPFGRNLLKNWDGKDKMGGWRVLSNAGNGFKVEKKPLINADDQHGMKEECPAKGCEHCWATSYGWGEKEQKVDLLFEGVTQELMDDLQPAIHVGEWTAARPDCGSEYCLNVSLLDGNNKEVDKFEWRREVPQWTDGKWCKIQHVFKSYGPGVKWLVFNHKGKDTQFWAGHFGSKMAAPFVRMTFDPPEVASPEEECN